MYESYIISQSTVCIVPESGPYCQGTGKRELSNYSVQGGQPEEIEVERVFTSRSTLFNYTPYFRSSDELYSAHVIKSFTLSFPSPHCGLPHSGYSKFSLIHHNLL